MRVIDRNKWERNEIFTFFSHVSNPFYSITFQVDVTNLYDYCKRNHLSFYYSMVYLVCSSLNKVENFRYSIRNDEVVLLDKRQPSFTVLDKETELFKIITPKLSETVEQFNLDCKEMVDKQKSFINMAEETDELYYMTCIPWVELTGFTDEMDILNPEFRKDGITRVTWGKYIEENRKKKLGLALSANHCFIDGVHIGKFVKELEKAIEAL